MIIIFSQNKSFLLSFFSPSFFLSLTLYSPHLFACATYHLSTQPLIPWASPLKHNCIAYSTFPCLTQAAPPSPSGISKATHKRAFNLSRNPPHSLPLRLRSTALQKKTALHTCTESVCSEKPPYLRRVSPAAKETGPSITHVANYPVSIELCTFGSLGLAYCPIKRAKLVHNGQLQGISPLPPKLKIDNSPTHTYSSRNPNPTDLRAPTDSR